MGHVWLPPNIPSTVPLLFDVISPKKRLQTTFIIGYKHMPSHSADFPGFRWVRGCSNHFGDIRSLVEHLFGVYFIPETAQGNLIFPIVRYVLRTGFTTPFCA
jgi:hypothetical protein